MKNDIVDFMPNCENFHHVKYETPKACRFTSKNANLEWKWKRIMMDFEVSLYNTLGKFDYICVVIDRLTKPTHFIPVRIDNNAE